MWTGNCQRDHKTAIEILKDKRLRTKYLDREDIESLGWKFYKESLMCLSGGVLDLSPVIKYTKGNWMLIYHIERRTINLTAIDVCKTEDYCHVPALYEFPCKSINEFRKIMKYLLIS